MEGYLKIAVPLCLWAKQGVLK